MDILISRGEISRHQVKMNERPRLQRAEIRTLSNNNSIDNDDDDDEEECFIEAEGPDYDHDSKIDQKDDVRQSQQESRKLSQELVLTHSNSIQSTGCPGKNFHLL